MAAELQKGSGEGEVSNCVGNIVHAFTNGLNIFKRLRERRRKRKSKHKHRTDEASDAELQLSNSLRRGPKEIKDSYERCYGEKGDRFAKGDAIAHHSLAETLIKLNTGLVSIIATFLSYDSKTSHLNLDYKSLTNLSDASRREALESLSQLYTRLSQSQLQLHRTAGQKAEPEKRRQTGPKQKAGGPTVARVPVKHSSQRQLVMVRPKNARKGSSSSSSSTKSQSTAASPPYTPPLGSPLPRYSPVDPYPPQKAPTPRVNNTSGRRRAGSFDGPRPTTWPVRPHDAVALPPPVPPKLPLSRRSPPPREKHASPPPSAGLRRRMDKVTPSTYTFASDSTKLGEIPQRNWTVPWNYEEAERLNAEAAINGYPLPAVAERPRTKKGLFSFLKRGSAQAA